MIRHAKISEIDHIISITKACARAMEKKNIFQWNEYYPSHTAFEIDAKRNELYVFCVDEQLIGSITISTKMDEEYIPIEWLTKNGHNIYIHRLCVHPDFQGQGYAQQLMAFAENFAKNNGYLSVRLDTFSQNKRNQRFYETRGYQKLGDIFFSKQSKHPFHCYELVF
jgi:ribosomal protein S18 acetylase RimI-like enzyme